MFRWKKKTAKENVDHATGYFDPRVMAALAHPGDEGPATGMTAAEVTNDAELTKLAQRILAVSAGQERERMALVSRVDLLTDELSRAGDLSDGRLAKANAEIDRLREELEAREEALRTERETTRAAREKLEAFEGLISAIRKI